MAQRVIWSPRAVRLLEEAADHIALDSPASARRLVEQVLAAAESLSELADRGRFVPELREQSHRELLIDSYRLIYRTTSEVVVLVAFVHGARDFRAWWRKQRVDRAPN